MSRYDRNTNTTRADVSREASEASAEVKDAVGAVVGIVAGTTSVDEAKTEIKEAVDAVVEAVEAATDLVVDSTKRFFKTVFGFRLHDPHQNKTVEATEPTEAEHTEWMKLQIDAGLIVETDKDGTVLSAPVAPPSKAAREEVVAEGTETVPPTE